MRHIFCLPGENQLPRTFDFKFDVFLSHSAKDKEHVRPLAERLRKDGLRVWFDDWVLKPSDSISAKIEEGLEQARVLVLCMSANAFGSDWGQLEATTFRFRDPMNQERRFIPLRLDDAPIKSSLAHFLYIDWYSMDHELEYAMLIGACIGTRQGERAQKQPTSRGTAKTTIQLGDPGVALIFFQAEFSPDCSQVLAVLGSYNNLGVLRLEKGSRSLLLKGHTQFPDCVAWSPDGKHALSGAEDQTVRLWDLERGRCLRVLRGHTAEILSVAWSPNGKHALSGATDQTVRLWDRESDSCLRVLRGHAGRVQCLAWSPDRKHALSGADDKTLRLWHVESGFGLRTLRGHTDGVLSIAWSPDGKHALSGSADKTLRLWDVESGLCLRVLEGHTGGVSSVAWNPDGKHALSASNEALRMWDVESGRCVRALREDTTRVLSVAWSPDGRRAYSVDLAGIVRVRSRSRLVSMRAGTVGARPLVPASDQVQYTNAKVLLVGESGVGKTGLSNYLAHAIKVDDGKPLPSTDGAWATHWPLTREHDKRKANLEREIWLWDFAGQVDYRLVHQLFMDDTAAAVLVFNPQNENPFEGLGNWDRDLQKAARKPFAKLLAAARIDRGGLIVSANSMRKFMKERGFALPLYETSAKTGKGCDELREAIVKAIDWKNIPETTSPELYHRMKQEVLRLRDGGLVLIRVAELKQRMEMTLRGEVFELTDLETVLDLLAGPGMIQRLDFGGFILLRPEVLSHYAAALVRKLRQHPQELGCIREDEVLTGDLDYQDFKRLTRDDETVVLRTLLETFVSRAWCLRQPSGDSAILTFPSYFRREPREQSNDPNVLVTYRFDGPAHDIYATLVVRLHHTMAFQSTDLWSSAADFTTQTGAKLGFSLEREAEGSSRLAINCALDVDDNSRVLFLRYVHDHLLQYAQNVVRLRHYSCINKRCKNFRKAFKDREAIDEALAPGGLGKVFCGKCGKPILLRDVIEEKFDSTTVKEHVRQLESKAQIEIDNESRELILVGHAKVIVAEAGQIYRGYTNGDHGIDGEIEFKHDNGHASGRRLYVQLKSGDSYLQRRGRDGAEIFRIKNARWITYWQQQAYPVMLVIRTSDGEIRWMDASAYLRRECVDGKPVRQIVFEGERFDSVSVRRWRDNMLGRRFSDA